MYSEQQKFNFRQMNDLVTLNLKKKILWSYIYFIDIKQLLKIFIKIFTKHSYNTM